MVTRSMTCKDCGLHEVPVDHQCPPWVGSHTRPDPPKPLPHQDWSKAKYAHCGCGNYQRVVKLEGEWHCAPCVDALRQQRKDLYLAKLEAYVEHLEALKTLPKPQIHAGYLHMSGHMINEGLARTMKIDTQSPHWRKLFLVEGE